MKQAMQGNQPFVCVGGCGGVIINSYHIELIIVAIGLYIAVRLFVQQLQGFILASEICMLVREHN